MSRIIYQTTASGPKWSAPQAIFTSTEILTGPLSVRQGRHFGASVASAVLGPDIMMPGGQTNNPPSVGGYPWDNTSTVFSGGPPVTFSQDNTHAWIRGHLINGRWGGTGNTWANLTPLTSIANPNHATIESYMDRYLTSSLNYENTTPYKSAWYGIYYAVQCSANPFAAAPANNDLYSYAPEFIRITWRAISIQKPVNQPVVTVHANPLVVGTPAAVHVLPFPAPTTPTINGWPVAVLPPGNVPGGAVLEELPARFPAQQANGFDGQIEIHQS
jgi:hypothetical protein